MPLSAPRAAAGIRSRSFRPYALKTTVDSRKILLVLLYMRTVTSRPEGVSGRRRVATPGVTGTERAVVLLGLIIIAVVLMALIALNRADQHRAPLRRGGERVRDLARDTVGLPLRTPVADGAC